MCMHCSYHWVWNSFTKRTKDMLTGTESAQKRPCSDGKKPNRLQQTRLLFMEVGNKPPGTLGTIIGTAPWVQVREDFTGKPEATVGKITMNQWIRLPRMIKSSLPSAVQMGIIQNNTTNTYGYNATKYNLLIPFLS